MISNTDNIIEAEDFVDSDGAKAVKYIRIGHGFSRNKTTSTDTGFVIPMGATILSIEAFNKTGATANLDFGTSADADALANNLSLSAGVQSATKRASWSGLASDTVVYVQASASSSAAGEVVITYVR